MKYMFVSMAYILYNTVKFTPISEYKLPVNYLSEKKEKPSKNKVCFARIEN